MTVAQRSLFTVLLTLTALAGCTVRVDIDTDSAAQTLEDALAPTLACEPGGACDAPPGSPHGVAHHVRDW